MSESLPRAAKPARRPLTATLPWAAFGLGLAALAALAAYKAWPLLFPVVAATAPLDPACDLRIAPCTAQFPNGGKVHFSMEPRSLPPLAPLRIAARLEGIEAGSVEVDFSGTDMNMGYNRVTLTDSGAGHYEGKAMLPICVRSRMGWEAKVMLHTSTGIFVAPFRFETVSRP